MRRTRVTAGAVASLLLLGGCWLQPGFDDERSGWNPQESTLTAATVDQAGLLWDTQLPEAFGLDDPISHRGTIFATADVAAVAALDAASGAVRWQTTAPANAIADLGAPVLFDDQLVVPAAEGSNGWHQLFDPATGAAVGSLPAAGPPVVDNTIVDGTSLATSGTDMTTFPFVATIDWEYQPTITYMPGAAAPGRKSAFLGAAILWSFGAEALGFSPACPPQPSGGCGPDWRVPVGGDVTGVASVGQGAAVFTDASGGVTVIDALEGRVRWTADVGPSIPVAPAVADGTIVVATSDGRVVALPAGGCGGPTCAPLWTAPLGDEPTTDVAAAGDVVYVAAGLNVKAYALDGCGGASTCAPLATFDAGVTITGGPIVDDGRMVVGTADGRVMAFGLPR